LHQLASNVLQNSETSVPVQTKNETKIKNKRVITLLQELIRIPEAGDSNSGDSPEFEFEKRKQVKVFILVLH
jgi:hypothetical protein